MITLISTPAVADTVDPTLLYRWVATESPINFRLFRSDWTVSLEANNAGYLDITLVIVGAFPGAIGDSVSVYNFYNDTMYTGLITNVVAGLISTDIVWEATMDIRYMNDNTLYGGYYFEARLTINGALEGLTVIASPDSYGYADVDVAGVLRIHTSLGKTGDHSALLMTEPTKSGSFSVEYRGCWYGSNELWTGADDEPPITSPPVANTWWYGECVRSEEQGTNLHEYVPSAQQDAPFLNSFDRPTYFLGMPFDITFINPDAGLTTATVTIKIFNSANTQLGPDQVTAVAVAALEGYFNSLNIDATTIPTGADHMTAKIVFT